MKKMPEVKFLRVKYDFFFPKEIGKVTTKKTVRDKSWNSDLEVRFV